MTIHTIFPLKMCGFLFTSRQHGPLWCRTKLLTPQVTCMKLKKTTSSTKICESIMVYSSFVDIINIFASDFRQYLKRRDLLK